MSKEEKCPYCGSLEFVEAKQDGYSCVAPIKTFTFKSQALYHTICLNCGSVVKSYVKKPRKLLTRETEKSN